MQLLSIITSSRRHVLGNALPHCRHTLRFVPKNCKDELETLENTLDYNNFSSGVITFTNSKGGVCSWCCLFVCLFVGRDEYTNSVHCCITMNTQSLFNIHHTLVIMQVRENVQLHTRKTKH